MTSRFEKRIREAKIPPLVERYFSETACADQMPLSTLAAFQKEALQEVVARAYEKSPFYNSKMTQAGISPQDIKSTADLAKFPFTTKEELRQNPWVLLACDKKDISVINVSTGTTGGKEIYAMHTWSDYYVNHLIVYPRLIPVASGDLCFVMLPYEMSSAGLSMHHKFVNGYQVGVMPAGKGGAYSAPEKAVRLMRELKPTVVVTSPSYAITLAEAAAESSFDLTGLRLKKIILGGEGCSPSFRKRVEKIWGTTANFSYGSMECGGIGSECDAHNGYHISEGHFLLEIVDPKTGKVLMPGEIGEVVITCLLRFDTPLIRYRTQDYGFIDETPCSCGVSLRRLFLRGRSVDQIVLKGKPFSPFYLEDFLMRLPEVGNWYQFVIKPGNNDLLKIVTEPGAGVIPTPELSVDLSGKLEAAIGVPCELQFVEQIPRSLKKAVRVVINS
ncbi:MAG: phenylacetate--CoA ligase family protein [Bacillota bacterium]